MPTTDWVLVESAGAENAADGAQAMQRLLLRYLPALKNHIVNRWRVPIEQAEDWLQEFVSVKVVQQRLIGQARREKGRFRQFLRTTLDAFVIGRLRHENAQKRMPQRWVAIESVEHDLESLEPDADRLFAIAWARQVIDQAIELMRSECELSKRENLWGLFESRIWLPIIEGAAIPPYDTVVQRYGFASPLQAANALVTAKRMFQRHIRLVLAQYADDADVEQELSELQNLLGARR
jgi:hypothetical protein